VSEKLRKRGGRELTIFEMRSAEWTGERRKNSGQSSNVERTVEEMKNSISISTETAKF